MASTRNEPNRTAIYATALTAFFAIAGIAVVDPILPVIGEEIRASTWQIELLFTAYIAVMALGMIPAVMATGRFGYKKILATGVSLVAVAAVLAALSTSIGQLAALRGLWGLGNAMFFATAMVLLVSLANDREWVVELFETCVGLGFAVGPLLGGLLGGISWRVPFFVCGVFMLVALLVSVTRLKDPAEKPAPLRVGQVFRLFRKPGFLALAAVTAAYNFCFFVVLRVHPGVPRSRRRAARARLHRVGRGARGRDPRRRAPARAPCRRRPDAGGGRRGRPRRARAPRAGPRDRLVRRRARRGRRVHGYRERQPHGPRSRSATPTAA